MKETRLYRRIVLAIALLLGASLLACQLGRTQPTPETIVVTPTSPPEATVVVPTPTPAPALPTPLPESPAQPSPATGIIVDNTDSSFAIEAGDWGTCQDGDCSGTSYGADFRFAEPGCDSCRAKFDFNVTTAGEYDVWTWWPWGEDRATDTPFTITYSGGSSTVNVDQRSSGDGWYWLGAFTFQAGESASVTVGGATTGYANADAIALAPAGAGAPSGPAAGVEPTPAPAAGAPVIQYFTSEESSTGGCYYLHWDVSEATAVYLDGQAVDSSSSTEVCPKETTAYTLRAENAAGSVEQAVTVAAGAAELPAASPTPPEQPAVPPAAGFRRIMFLHHSTGANLIEQGGVRQRLTALGYEFYDHGYNEDGLVLADGTRTGRNFNVPDDNTNPDGYAAIFAQPLHDPPDNTFSYLMQYDVIVFKSCFPVSLIESDEQLAEYKTYYLSIRDRMDQYPNKIFIVVTEPPEIPSETDAAMAARARAFTNWLASDEYLSGHLNVFTFNFFDRLADPATNMLRPEYQTAENDAHPNELANQTIAPLFVDFVDRAIKTYMAR